MKNTIYFLLAFILLGCQKDGIWYSEQALEAKNPIYLDANGITIKAKDWAEAGDSGVINDVLYTIVDERTLRFMIEENGDITKVCTSRITSMEELLGARKVPDGQNYWVWDKNIEFNQNISSWDTSNVTNMSKMFSNLEVFNQDIGSWNVSNVTDMSIMFSNAKSFNGDLSLWNTSNAIKMNWMFSSADTFNQDLSKWDVRNVTDMLGMFSRNLSFNGDISKWDVSNVTDMSYMFFKTSFNKDISKWDVSNVTTFSYMFRGAIFFNQNISLWNTSNAIKMNWMFSDADTFNQDLSKWDVRNVSQCTLFSYKTPKWALPKPSLSCN